ncbi:MAG: hypothetical protein AAFQ61_12555 [Cyanobacteria bacterium J06626_23]
MSSDVTRSIDEKRRQIALQAVNQLPLDALTELLFFIEYLKFKSEQSVSVSAARDASQERSSPAVLLAQIAAKPEEIPGDAFLGSDEDSAIYQY